MKISRYFYPFAALILAVTFAGVFMACDSSPDGVSNDIIDSDGKKIDFSGHYSNNGSSLVTANTGSALTWLVLMQSGSILEGYDNNNSTWKGKINGLESSVASFSLEGHTTAGSKVLISGTLDASSGSSTAVMKGSWLEESLSSYIYATASVTIITNNPSNPTNSTSALSVDPASHTFSSSGSSTKTFRAYNGTAPYYWSVSNNDLGSVTPTTTTSSGDYTTYTRKTATGTNTLTLRDGAGTTKTVTIIQQ